MAYTPTEWKNGDVITAEKLNKIENGIKDIPNDDFYITITYINEVTMDKTFEEITEAYTQGKRLLVKLVNHNNAILPLRSVSSSMGGATYNFVGISNISVFFDSSTSTTVHFLSVLIENNGTRIIHKSSAFTFN